MMRCFWWVAAAFTLSVFGAVDAFAQTPPPLVFTAPVPARPTAEPDVQVSTPVEDRGVALWAGTASDFGLGVSFSGRRWTFRSVASMTPQPAGVRDRPIFQQVDVTRPVFSTGSISIAAGAGLRQEPDGSRVLLGRVLGGSDLGGGRLQGSLVLERIIASPLRHDAADVVTSLGWSKRVEGALSLGVETLGQDLEGFWDPSEAEGGAKLLVGPSVQARSADGAWTASVTAGPVLRTVSTISRADVPAVDPSRGRHFGVFVSATWVPSARR